MSRLFMVYADGYIEEVKHALLISAHVRGTRARFYPGIDST